MLSKRTQLVKHGDEYAILIAQEMLDSIDATATTAFDVAIEEGVLAIRPVDAEERRRRRIALGVERINEKNRSDPSAPTP